VGALDVHRIDLQPTLREVAAKWKQVAGVRNLQFEERLDVQSLRVLGDQNSLRRLVDILLDNAIKYTPAPGKVTLSAGEDAGRVLVMVEDTGIGIKRDDQARIFERCYRQTKRATANSAAPASAWRLPHGSCKFTRVLSRWRANR